MLPVAMAIQHGTCFKVTAPFCDLRQRQYFEDLFNENGGVFSYDKNPLLPQNYKKNVLFFLLVWFMFIVQKRQSVQ